MRGLFGEETIGSNGAIGAPWQLCMKRSTSSDGAIDITLFDNVGEASDVITGLTVDGTVRGLMGLKGMPGSDEDQDNAGQYIRQLKEGYGAVIVCRTAAILIGFGGARERRGTPEGPPVPENFVHAGAQCVVPLAVGQAICVGAVPESVRRAVEMINASLVSVTVADGLEVTQLGSYREVDVTPVCDTAIYASGEVLFDSTVVTNAMRANDSYGFLTKLVITDEDDNTAAAMDLFFFSENVSLGTINGAPTISDANERNHLIGRIAIAAADWFDFGGCKAVCKELPALALLMKPAAGTRNVYVAAVTSGTPTQTASGIKMRLFFKDEL